MQAPAKRPGPNVVAASQAGAGSGTAAPIVGNRRKPNKKMVSLNGDVIKDLGNSLFQVRWQVCAACYSSLMSGWPWPANLPSKRPEPQRLGPSMLLMLGPGLAVQQISH